LGFIEFYKRLGFNVIPLKARSKEPVIKWSEFETRKTTEEELKQWFSKEDVNVGIVCGSVSGNLIVLDFESLEAFKRFLGKTPEELAVSTIVVKTARGYHLYVKTDKPISSFKIPELQLDVKGEGGYVVAPPSIHPTGVKYEFLGNPWKLDHIQKVDDLDEWIWLRAGELGVFRYGSEDDPPCIRLLLNGVNEGMRNEATVRLASYWLQFRRLEPEEAFNRLLEWNVRNSPPMNKKELKNCLESVLKHGYEYGCSGMVELGLCNNRLKSICNLKENLQFKKKRIKHTASAVLSDGRLIEEAYRNGKVFFLVYNPDGSINELEEVEDADTIYRPINNQDVETRQVLLPSRAEEYGSDEQLFNDILTFLNHWHEQGDGWERVVDVLYVFQTWVYDVFPQIPYRRALGRWGSGKSAWLVTVGSVCYRPMILAGCDSEASLRRTFDLWRGTALIDEADFSNTSLYASMVKILNIGSSRETGWYRCCDENDPKKILSFYVFGPKLLATRSRFKDTALESRCLTFISMEGSGEAPMFRAEKFKEWAQSLRNRLLLWRFRNRERIRGEAAQLEKNGLFKEVFENGVEKRIAQIMLPFIILFKEKGIVDLLKNMAVQKTEELKSLDEEEWLDEELRKMLKKIFDDAGKVSVDEKTRPLTDVGDSSVKEVERVKVVKEPPGFAPIEKPLIDFVKELYGENLEPEEKREYARKISRVLKNRYGVKIKPAAGNRRVAVLDGGLFRKITGAYFNYFNFFNHFNSTGSTETKEKSNVTQQSSEEAEKEVEDSKPEIILSKENFEALFEAVKSFGSDYWTASQVVDEYARAGGREFWRFIQALSSEEWLKTNPAFWLEQHPRLKGMFRLRRR
jgi:hypothetical protein